MAKVDNAALREHDVVIQFVGKGFPHLHRQFVEVLVFRQQIIGADRGCVASDIAGAKPAFLDDCDVADAEFLGKVKGSRQPVPAAADDDDIILRFRLSLAPRFFPAPVAGERVFQQLKS